MNDLDINTEEVAPERVERYLTPERQYACLYWAQHLSKARLDDCDYQHIRGFLDDYSYPWIEALAWMQKLSDAITSINTLELLTHVSQSLA
jgi:hypothetical protein